MKDSETILRQHFEEKQIQNEKINIVKTKFKVGCSTINI